jgi:L-lactate utilization protein LutC
MFLNIVFFFSFFVFLISSVYFWGEKQSYCIISIFFSLFFLFLDMIFSAKNEIKEDLETEGRRISLIKMLNESIRTPVKNVLSAIKRKVESTKEDPSKEDQTKTINKASVYRIVINTNKKQSLNMTVSKSNTGQFDMQAESKKSSERKLISKLKFN